MPTKIIENKLRKARETLRDEILGNFGMLELDLFAHLHDFIELKTEQLLTRYTKTLTQDIEHAAIKLSQKIYAKEENQCQEL